MRARSARRAAPRELGVRAGFPCSQRTPINSRACGLGIVDIFRPPRGATDVPAREVLSRGEPEVALLESALSSGKTPPWHTLEVAEVYRQLRSAPQGLSGE